MKTLRDLLKPSKKQANKQFFVRYPYASQRVFSQALLIETTEGFFRMRLGSLDKRMMKRENIVEGKFSMSEILPLSTLATCISCLSSETHRDAHGNMISDKIGFSSVDDRYGKDLNLLDFDEWTLEHTYNAQQLIKKYQKQLLNVFDIDITKIEKIEKPDTLRKKRFVRKLIEKNNKLFLYIAYEDLSALKKTNIVREWIHDDKCWLIPHTEENIQELEPLVKDLGVCVTLKAKKLISTPQKVRREITLLDKDHFAVFFPYCSETVNNLKASFDKKRFETSPEKFWRVPINKQSVANLEVFATVNNIEVTEDVQIRVVEWLKKQEALAKERKKAIQLSESFDSSYEVEGLNGELRTYQKVACQYFKTRSSGFIADDMGIGKTIEAIAITKDKNAFPVIVISPKSMVYTWKKEFEKWLPQYKTHVFTKYAKKKVLGKDIYILNYDKVKKYIETLESLNAKMLILDESQNCKNYLKRKNKVTGVMEYKVQRVKYVKRLSQEIPYKLLLSGTPIENRHNELISQLDIADMLDKFGGFKKFIKKYCDSHCNSWGVEFSGSTNSQELHENLRAIGFIRRIKEDVLKELPGKQTTDIPVTLCNVSEYQKAEKETIEVIKERALRAKDFLATIEGLSEKEVRNAKKERAKDKEDKALRAKILTKINLLRKISAEGKVADCKEWVENLLSNSKEKLIIFCHHKDVAEFFAEKFSSLLITGDTPVSKRTKVVEEFQTNENERLIVLTLKTGSQGLTLTAASNVAFFELPWTPADIEQGGDRANRYGQKNKVNVYRFIAQNTIDERMIELLEEKKQIIDSVMDGKESFHQGSIYDKLVRSYE